MTRLGTTAEIFPKEFQNGSGATHTDMFLAWALLSGMGGSTHVTDSPDNLHMAWRRQFLAERRGVVMQIQPFLEIEVLPCEGHPTFNEIFIGEFAVTGLEEKAARNSAT